MRPQYISVYKVDNTFLQFHSISALSMKMFNITISQSYSLLQALRTKGKNSPSDQIHFICLKAVFQWRKWKWAAGKTDLKIRSLNIRTTGGHSSHIRNQKLQMLLSHKLSWKLSDSWHQSAISSLMENPTLHHIISNRVVQCDLWGFHEIIIK